MIQLGCLIWLVAAVILCFFGQFILDGCRNDALSLRIASNFWIFTSSAGVSNAM
jgi:hypothetical protein